MEHGSGADVHGKAIRVLVYCHRVSCVYLPHYVGKDSVDVVLLNCFYI